MIENSNKNKTHPNLLIEEWLEKMNQGAKKMANDEKHIPNDTTARAIKEAQANLATIRISSIN